MTPTLSLIAGIVGGALFVLIAYAIRRHTRRILFYGLIGAALPYVIFSIHGHSSASWIALELLGVVVYGGVALLGLRRSQWWLVTGWALHPVWDIALHYFGPGSAFAPAPYALGCLAWDPIVAGYIAYRILGPAKEMSAPLADAFAAELSAARHAEEQGLFPSAWRALERAHVLSQLYAMPHLRVHWLMAAFALRHGDLRELLGQIPRLLLAAPGSWTGRAPLG
ncbi:MAG TPA: DUF6010 family protein, partial [Myxococcales bacterium]|nr:DUF6010 family protein [Myxococcales bacterium]